MSDNTKQAVPWSEATAKGIDLARDLGRFFGKILGPAAEHIGGAVGDWAKFYRYKNLLRIGDKVEAIHRQRQLDGKTIPISPRYAIPLIEHASVEDDDAIQEKWAALIANATDPGRAINLQKMYIEVLSSLEPLDAKVLDFLGQDGLEEKYPFLVPKSLNADELAEQISSDPEMVRISLQNLYRLGCIIDSWEASIDGLDHGYAGFRVNNPKSNYRLSHFGQLFMKACKPN